MSARTVTSLRIAAVVALLCGLVILGTRPTVRAYAEISYLRELTAGAGLEGVLAFLSVWVVAYLMQIPGVVFVVAALVCWGTWVGGLVAFVGMTVSTSVNFWALRGVGGSPVSQLEYDFARRMLEKLDAHPIRTVVLLRLFFLVNPLVNLSLVLTDVRFRHYVVGSMVGFLVPLGVIMLAAETMAEYVLI